jgi:hypothetical protein
MTRRTLELFAFWAAVLVAGLAFHAWLASLDEQQRLQSTLAAQKQVLAAADARERTRDAALNETLTQIEKLKRAPQTPQQIARELPTYLHLPQPISLLQAPGTDGLPGGAKAGSLNGTNVSESESDHHLTHVSPTIAICNDRFNGSKTETSDNDNVNCIHNNQPSNGISLGPLGATTSQIVTALAIPSPKSSPCADAADCSAEIPAADLKPLYNYVQDCRACQTELAAAKQTAADDATKMDALTQERDAAVTAAKGGTFLRRLRRNLLWFAAGIATAYYIAKK